MLIALKKLSIPKKIIINEVNLLYKMKKNIKIKVSRSLKVNPKKITKLIL